MRSERPVYVHKFGGTSVATAERIRRAVRLVLDEDSDGVRIVVVSALGGVTDTLLEAIDLALARAGNHGKILQDLGARHLAVAEAVASEAERDALRGVLEARMLELTELLDGVYLLRECTDRARDAVLGMGEQLSAPIAAAAFRAAGQDAEALDARTFICTDDAFGEANVLFDETAERVRARFASAHKDDVFVVTGYVGATLRKVSTTLGRSGSDYTATIIAGALGAARVTIWTDVDGVLSADPRLAPEAFALPRLSYREASELAYFGAEVLHSRTMRPLLAENIPLCIRNTLNPAAPGTRISQDTTTMEGHVKAITTIRDVAVVMLEGTGLVGIPGISARALTALAARNISVFLIAQASSEQSLCTVVSAGSAELATRLIREEFELELVRGDVARVFSIGQCAIVSVVGDNMRQRPGLAGRMFSTLGRDGVNVLAIAQGASETNISAVVSDAEGKHAVHVLHDEFALLRHRVHVFLIGAGVVGRALLKMLEEQQETLLHSLRLNIHLVGLANTRKMAWNVGGIPFSEALEALEQGEQGGIDAVMDQLQAGRMHRMMVIDATASEDVALKYPELLSRSISIITPNKRANTQSQAFYEELLSVAHRRRVPYLYETTVGAGLPVISTLRDLIRSGDRVIRIEGVFSGTLAYIFYSMATGMKFSEAVRAARRKGYTEPDPREDLQGEDVARKILILAREAGLEVERSDIAVDSLAPPALRAIPLPAFMERLPELDDAWRARVEEAAAAGQRLQYIGRMEEGRLSVRTRRIKQGSPFARLDGSNNMVVYTTERYLDNPLVVQGPGAGPQVTAAGILADLIKAAELGA